MKKKILWILITAFMVFGLTGCGTNGGNSAADDVDAAYPDAVSILTVGWEQLGEQFAAIGGSLDNPVDNAPGAVSLSDTDMMTNSLLIPEEVQKDITDVASVVHMMNANTFTGVAIRVNEMETEDAAVKIKDTFMANHFMCGVPEKIKIVTIGHYIVYAYGETETVDNFMNGLENLPQAAVFADEVYQ